MLVGNDFLGDKLSSFLYPVAIYVEDPGERKDMTKETNGYHFHEQNEYEEELEIEFDESDESLLTDNLDHEILMHRDAHFGGKFEVMLDYYAEEHVGCNPDFDIERIQYLAAIEKETGKDLAPLLLNASEAEAVAKARKAYQDFKKIYESNRPENRYPKLIADLILSEEEEPVAEMESIIEEGSKIVPTLLSIVRSEDSYDPLFPGYGFAPYLAILCLGKIKDPSSIIPIFETISKETLFGEEASVAALVEMGDKAKEFLLELIASRPITQDNITAAYVLSAYPPEETIGKACLDQLKDPEARANPLFAAYLLGPCEFLIDEREKAEFQTISKDPTLPRELKVEMERTIRTWEQ